MYIVTRVHLINFNPRSHERSDSNNRWICGTLSISIHAPTRGATVFHFHYPLILSISIHAPTRGATYALRTICVISIFQSTLPREERPEASFLFHFSLLSISIHAPTRGATVFPLIGIFNRLYFNPRSHERSDFGSSTSTSMNTISIHAPTRGATYNGSVANGLSGISIHAPTRGATPGFFLIAKFTYISIHAPTRGATNAKNQYAYLKYISIHAPTRGATSIGFSTIVR